MPLPQNRKNYSMDVSCVHDEEPYADERCETMKERKIEMPTRNSLVCLIGSISACFRKAHAIMAI